MASQLEEFLKEKKIDVRRLLATSARIERLRPEDRAVKLEKRLARSSEDAAKKKEAAAKKARSGKPVTARAIETVFSGGSVSGPIKTRILRAVNAVLETKKQEPVALQAIFGKKA